MNTPHVFNDFIHYVETTTKKFNGKKYEVFKAEFSGDLLSLVSDTELSMEYIFNSAKLKAGFKTITGKFDLNIHVRADKQDIPHIVKQVFDGLHDAEIFSSDKNINYLLMKHDHDECADSQYVKVKICQAVEV